MLRRIEAHSPAKGLHIDFSNDENHEQGNGLYRKDGRLAGMLEGKDYKCLDLVSPFMGMFVDRCCEERVLCPTTKFFTQHADLVANILCYNSNSTWNIKKIHQLEIDIKSFKEKALQLYGGYSVSELCTEKFHLLDHVVQNINRLGGISWGDAGVYEYSHTLVKSAYRCGSKRKASAMDDTMQNFLRKTVMPLSNTSENADSTCSQSRPKITRMEPSFARNEAINADCARLVKAGMSFTIFSLAKGKIVHRKLRKAKEVRDIESTERLTLLWNSLDEVTKSILPNIGEYSTRVLVCQLREKIYENREECEDYVITCMTSAYVASGRVPTAHDYNVTKTGIIPPQCTQRYSQRVVSNRGFYGAKCLRQDCVLIHGVERDGEGSTL